jgi:hypothetical protein
MDCLFIHCLRALESISQAIVSSASVAHPRIKRRIFETHPQLPLQIANALLTRTKTRLALLIQL